jgi:tetratricopeptide (TPR) repeat protein
MKTIRLLILLTICSTSLYAQSEYEKAMQETLDKFAYAFSISDMKATAAQFERIAEMETQEWLPPYYASLVYSFMSFRTEDPGEKEELLTQAQTLLDKAIEIAPEESEIYTVQGMIYTSFITLDPAANGQSYSAKANGAFQTSIKLNPENPRPYYMQAYILIYTPEEYGGGPKAALPLLEKAIELFKVGNPENPLAPSWGLEDCQTQYNNCKEAA